MPLIGRYRRGTEESETASENVDEVLHFVLGKVSRKEWMNAVGEVCHSSTKVRGWYNSLWGLDVYRLIYRYVSLIYCVSRSGNITKRLYQKRRIAV